MPVTYAGQLAASLPELGQRELHALASENHWHESPNRYARENRRSAILTITQRAEDAMLPEYIR